MISIMKDICIFMIIAQAILFFVPNHSYMKYVRILVGILMIFRMTQPLFHLIMSEEEQSALLQQMTTLEEAMEQNMPELDIEDNRMGIYQSIEEEIRNRLCQCEIEEYEVTKVELAGEENTYGQEGELKSICVVLKHRTENNEDNIRIQLEPVKIEQKQGREQRKELEQKEAMAQEKQLKQIFGECLGVSPDRIRIVVQD